MSCQQTGARLRTWRLQDELGILMLGVGDCVASDDVQMQALTSAMRRLFEGCHGIHSSPLAVQAGQCGPSTSHLVAHGLPFAAPNSLSASPSVLTALQVDKATEFEVGMLGSKG